MRSSPNKQTTMIATSLLLIIAVVVIVALKPPRPDAGANSAVQEADEVLAFADWPVTPELAFGRTVYQQNCVGCHGEEGLGDGPGAVLLNPLPRNFQRGAFKFRTTPTGKLPLADDLVKTIANGLPGSSMPAFRLMPEPERQAVARYVQHMSTYRYGKREVAKVVKREELTLDQVVEDRIDGIWGDVWDKRVASLQPIPVPPSPKVTDALLAMGKKRYLGECNRCHGDTGRGDGISSYTLRDWKDEVIVARDFTTGVFRSGSRAVDIFIRMRTGLNGTPMPSIPGTDEEIWAMSHYILSLKDPNAYVNPVHSGRTRIGGNDDR